MCQDASLYRDNEATKINSQTTKNHPVFQWFSFFPLMFFQINLNLICGWWVLITLWPFGQHFGNVNQELQNLNNSNSSHHYIEWLWLFHMRHCVLYNHWSHNNAMKIITPLQISKLRLTLQRSSTLPKVVHPQKWCVTPKLCCSAAYQSEKPNKYKFSIIGHTYVSCTEWGKCIYEDSLKSQKLLVIWRQM